MLSAVAPSMLLGSYEMVLTALEDVLCTKNKMPVRIQPIQSNKLFQM